MLKGIIKENQIKGECMIKSHCFPSFGTSSNEIICDEEKKFVRITDEEDIEEIVTGNEPGTYSKNKFKKQLEEVERLAYEKGYNHGLADGKLCGRKEVEPVLMKFEQALCELELIRQNISVLAEKEAVDLSMAIARKIVGNEITVNKNVISHIVKEALKKVHGHENIKIKLNPSELQIVKEAEYELKNIANSVENIEIIADDNISPGGCIIETNIGDIDARIEKQLKVVEDAFKMESE